MKSLENEDADSLESVSELKYVWSLRLKLDFRGEIPTNFSLSTANTSRSLAGEFISENT